MTSRAGTRLGQYVILSTLGTGGMGEVFLAEDTRLHRKVAIKRVRADVIDSTAHRRLLQEAQAAARLDHPNICGIHEVGDDDDGPYIVMPLVEGETLSARIARGPLPIDESIGIVAQVADALAAAHGHGILHRDIKPANIMITARGHVRVMDFGLAKFTDSDPSLGHAETASVLTKAGSTFGTAAYMSPEQARGGTVDARSDLFSLGVVAHEMVAGRRPFDGQTVADTVTAVLTQEPLPLEQLRPGTPDGFQRIVAKLLRKNREERYQSAADLLVDVRDAMRRAPNALDKGSSASSPRSWVAPVAVAALVVAVAAGFAIWRNQNVAAPHIDSIAVLPLANLSADGSQQYFADAMTEELTSQLSRIKSLRVISRTSSGQYKDTKLSAREIASQLHVDGIIEGSVVREGDSVRITAQLIHGPTDRHLWSNSYDGQLREMLALQRRVAEAIALEVHAAVTTEEQLHLRTSRSIDPRAMDLYLRGRELLYSGTMSTGFSRPLVEQAAARFSEALDIENWAEPHAGLAMARHWMATAGINPNVLFPASREAAQEAIRLDDRVADAHGSLAYIAFAYDWDLPKAEREYRRAIELNPVGNFLAGYSLLLGALGRSDEARTMLDRAAAIDPLSSLIPLERARAALFTRNYAETILQAQRLPANLKFLRHLIIGQALTANGHPAEAIAEFDQAGQDFTARAGGASALARAGRRAEARARLPELEVAVKSGEDETDFAAVYASLGDHDRAADTLERAYAKRASWFPLINVDPRFDDLRRDARFKDLLRRIGIPQT